MILLSTNVMSSFEYRSNFFASWKSGFYSPFLDFYIPLFPTSFQGHISLIEVKEALGTRLSRPISRIEKVCAKSKRRHFTGRKWPRTMWYYFQPISSFGFRSNILTSWKISLERISSWSRCKPSIKLRKINFDYFFINIINFFFKTLAVEPID